MPLALMVPVAPRLRLGRSRDNMTRSMTPSLRLSRVTSGLVRLMACEPEGSVTPSGGDPGMTVLPRFVLRSRSKVRSTDI